MEPIQVIIGLFCAIVVGGSYALFVKERIKSLGDSQTLASKITFGAFSAGIFAINLVMWQLYFFPSMIVGGLVYLVARKNGSVYPSKVSFFTVLADLVFWCRSVMFMIFDWFYGVNKEVTVDDNNPE